MGTFKFDGFKVGQVIKAFDFEPRNACPGAGSFVEGVILDVYRDGTLMAPYAHYVIRATRDVAAGVDVARRDSRVGLPVLVPMETTRDYAGRVGIV